MFAVFAVYIERRQQSDLFLSNTASDAADASAGTLRPLLLDSSAAAVAACRRSSVSLSCHWLPLLGFVRMLFLLSLCTEHQQEQSSQQQVPSVRKANSVCRMWPNVLTRRQQ